MVRDNIVTIINNISSACARVGRNPQEVTLMAVTKYASSDMAKEAIRAGITHIGENKIQDAEKKFRELGEMVSKVTRHMIGLFHEQPGARSWRQALSTLPHENGADETVIEKALDAMNCGKLHGAS